MYNVRDLKLNFGGFAAFLEIERTKRLNIKEHRTNHINRSFSLRVDHTNSLLNIYCKNHRTIGSVAHRAHFGLYQKQQPPLQRKQPVLSAKPIGPKSSPIETHGCSKKGASLWL